MYRLLYQDGDTPQSYTFTTGEVVIGRSPDCQIVLKDFGISRNHAKITVNEDGVSIADLKSKNGTQVNGVLPMHEFTVTIAGCSREEAEQVLTERLGHDEDYGFDYEIAGWR